MHKESCIGESPEQGDSYICEYSHGRMLIQENSYMGDSLEEDTHIGQSLYRRIPIAIPHDLPQGDIPSFWAWVYNEGGL